MSPCPRKLYHWRGLALGLFAYFFCENPTRTVAWWESWKRGQKRLSVRCSFGFSRDFRILEMMGHAWSSVAGAEWSQPEPMRQTVYTLDSRAEEVRTSKLVRVQRFIWWVSPRCWTLNYITGIWLCLNLVSLMLWFFRVGMRTNITCFGFL